MSKPSSQISVIYVFRSAFESDLGVVPVLLG